MGDTMATDTNRAWTRMSQLLANVESLRAKVTNIQESDPMLGEKWKAGMLRYWGDKLDEAVERAKAYAVEAGLPIEEV